MTHALTLSRLRSLSTKFLHVWLRGLLDNRQALGSELVESAHGFPVRMPVDYDDMLSACETLGWIERSFFAPSVSQQAFCGLQYGNLATASDDAKKLHASWFAWRVIDAAAVESFIGNTPSTKTKIVVGDLVKWSPLFVAQIQGGAAMRNVFGTVVGFSTGLMSDFPRVTWDDDPKDEPACQAPIEKPPPCVTNTSGLRVKRCACSRVPYAARPVSPKAIRRV
jgi:hypothetical protein